VATERGRVPRDAGTDHLRAIRLDVECAQVAGRLIERDVEFLDVGIEARALLAPRLVDATQRLTSAREVARIDIGAVRHHTPLEHATRIRLEMQSPFGAPAVHLARSFGED